MIKRIYLTALWLVIWGGAWAQSPWTLRRCIDYAVEHNIEIRQQALNVDDAEIELNTSKNSRLPSLGGSANQSFNFGRTMSQGSGVYEVAKAASTTQFSVSSSVPVFAGMRISRQIETNELNLKAATENLNKAKENLELQVASLYLEALFKKEIVRVYQEQADLTARQVARTEALLEAGKVPRSQLFDIKAQLAKDQLNLTNACNDRDLALLNLAQSLSLPGADGFDVVEPGSAGSIVADGGAVPDPQQIYEAALGIKPHVKEARYRLESSQRNLKVTQAAFWPTLNLGLSYTSGFNHLLTAGFANPSVVSQWKDNQREAIGFNLSVPIFNRLQTRNQVRQARLNIRNRSLELDNVKLTLYKEIQQAYQSAVASVAKYNSTRAAYQAAAEAFVYAQERYDVGMLAVYEYSEAQTKMVTSRSEQLQAQYDFLFRTKILDFYRGVPITLE